MSKIGPRPLLDTEIRLSIQLDRIPMTAVYSGRAAVSAAMDSCMNGMRSYRIGALAAPDSSDPEECGSMVGVRNVLTVILGIRSGLSYRKVRK